MGCATSSRMFPLMGPPPRMTFFEIDNANTLAVQSAHLAQAVIFKQESPLKLCSSISAGARNHDRSRFQEVAREHRCQSQRAPAAIQWLLAQHPIRHCS